MGELASGRNELPNYISNCRVISPETIYTQLKEMDSVSCIHVHTYSHRLPKQLEGVVWEGMERTRKGESDMILCRGLGPAWT